MATIFAPEFLEHLITNGLELPVELSSVLSQLEHEHSRDIFIAYYILKTGWDILLDCKYIGIMCLINMMKKDNNL